MKNEVLGAGGVLENGVDGGHGAPEVSGVKSHCHVYCMVGAVGLTVGEDDGRAIWGVVELWSFFEDV